MRQFVFFLALMAITAGGWPQAARNVKVWRFSLPNGSLEVQLSVHSDGRASLGIAPYGEIPQAPVSEQVPALKQVLDEMPNLGVDPRKLVYMDTRLWARDAREKLAFVCVDSEEWQGSMRNGGKGKEQLVVDLLNRSRAYEPYNEAFKPYGIQIRVTEAEMVGLMHFSHIPPRNSTDRKNGRLLVPADAAIGMRFSQVDSNPNPANQQH